MNDQSKTKEELLKELQKLQEEYDSLKKLVQAKRFKSEKREKYQTERQDKFRSLYENMNEGSALHEILFNDQGIPEDYVIIEANPAFEKQLGISLKDIVGRTSKEVYGVSNPPYFEIYLKVALTGFPKVFETFFPPLEKYFSISVYSPYRNNFVTIFQDITERKLVEKSLQKSEAELKRVQQITHIGSFYIDLITNQVTWTEELYKIYGFDPSVPVPLLNESQKLFTPESWELLSRAIAEVRETGVTYEIELKTIRKDLSHGWMWARGEAIFDADGIIIGLWGAVQDITERKQIEEELRKAKERAEESERNLKSRNEELQLRNIFIQTILDRLPIGLSLNHIDGGEATYMNKRFEEIYGWSSKEITSITSFFEHVYPNKEYHDQVIDRIMSDIKSGDPERLHWENIQITRKDGSKRIVDAVNIPLFEQNIMVSTVMDVTRLVQIQHDLTIEKEHAEESDRLKSAFLANVSHEIRTPMNGILGFAELLKEPRLTGEEQQEFIAIIEKSGKRMLNIINDIVDISRIEAGQMEINVIEFNIDEQLESLFAFFKPEVEAKGIHFQFKNMQSATQYNFKTDRIKLLSILTHLLKNAIKYTDNGLIEFGYINKGSILEFYVKDTGIGIAKNRQNAIFESFVQADIGDKRAFQGAGLGLTITLRYVQMLGGEIWVESEERKGSIFYFTIPNHIGPIEMYPTETIPDFKAEIQINPLKILIAEDNSDSLKFLEILVKDFSRDIVKVETGNEAVSALLNNPDIDLILMDIKMPGMDGYEATRQIREFNSKVVIIAQTAFALAGDLEKIKAIGCNDYLSKPITKTQLIQLIDKYFKN